MANAFERGGRWRPPVDWFTPDRLKAAKEAIQRIAGSPVVSGGSSGGGDQAGGSGAGRGGAARTQFNQLLADGFDDAAIDMCKHGGGGELQWVNINQRRLVWETELCDSFPDLAPVAARLLSQHATSAAVERDWSKWGKLYAPDRSSMAPSTAVNLMFIANAWHLQHRPPPQQLLCEEAFWMQLQHEQAGSDTDEE